MVDPVERESRPQIGEVVVVEGIHDKQRVQAAVEAEVVVLGGDRIARQTVSVLQRAATVRGVIILTDPDGAGERIRRRIDAVVPGCKHAQLPRSQAISSQGLGVEHANVANIRRALMAAKPTAPVANKVALFSNEDLIAARLVACVEATARRTLLGDILGIGYGNAKAFLHKLNTLGVTRADFAAALERLPSR